MAFDEKLASRIEAAIHTWPGIEPKKMFGSIGWLFHGNMCFGTWRDSLIVRCSIDDWPRLLEKKHVGEFDITGRSMKGWLMVGPAAIATDAGLERWLKIAREFVRTLPSKVAKTKKVSARPKAKRPGGRA